jgi:hypothetical protein
MLPFSDAPKLFIPTLRTSVRGYRNGIAMWRGLISISIWVFPTIHHLDGLLMVSPPQISHFAVSIRCCLGQKEARPRMQKGQAFGGCVCLSISRDGRDSRRVSATGEPYALPKRSAGDSGFTFQGRIVVQKPQSVWVRLQVGGSKTYAVEKTRSDETCRRASNTTPGRVQLLH